MKKIYIDYDGVLVKFSNELFKDINKYFKQNKIINKISEEKIHLQKHLFEIFQENNEKNQKFINNLFKKINDYFSLKENEINMDNMNRRHQKITKYFKENTIELKTLVEEINKYFKEEEKIKEITVENFGKMNKEIKDFNKEKMGYYKNAKIYERAKEFLKKLKDEGYEITILTTNMNEDQERYKNTHITIIFSNLIDNVIHTPQKYKYSTDGIFIDDKLSNIKKHKEKNKTEGFWLVHEEDLKEISEEEKSSNKLMINFNQLLTTIKKKKGIKPKNKKFQKIHK